MEKIIKNSKTIHQTHKQISNLHHKNLENHISFKKPHKK